MKQVTTWLNEEEYKHFMKIAEKRHTSSYAIMKKLLRDYMDNEIIIFSLPYRLVCYWFILYSLIVVTYLLVFR